MEKPTSASKGSRKSSEQSATQSSRKGHGDSLRSSPDTTKRSQRSNPKEGERENDRDKDREKNKERDRDKEKERHREKEKERDREKEKERDRDKDKDRDKEREKDRDREREREKERERNKEREKEQEQEKEKERDRDKDREKEREPDRDREKERERDKDREKERELFRDREKERDRDKEKERERVKEREKEKEKEREREKEKEREKDPQKLRSKEKKREQEKDREHDRDRENDRDERDKERDHEFEKGEKEKRDEKEKSAKGDKEKKRDDHKDKPLRETPKSNLSTSELEERVSKMREERLKANAEQTSSAKKSDANNDIHFWVNKSRKLEQKKKIDEKVKASRMAKILAEQDNEEDDDDSSDELKESGYGGKDLAGLKVRHGLDKVMEGHAVVLTLKDASVLDGNDVNEATDELENIEMAQQIARQEAYKAAKKKPGVYKDKFNNDMNAIAPRTILPQYDDVVKDEGMVLDETGGLSEETRKKLDEVRQRLEGSSARESLNGSITTLASDYYTQEDMLPFKKPKKKKKLRRKEKLDLDELEAEAVAAGLGYGDLRSRKSQSRRSQKQLDEQKAEADARKHAYQNALSKAEDASRILREENITQSMEVDNTDSSVFGIEEDEELFKSLERARQAALKKQNESGGTGAGPQAIVARVAALKEQPVSASHLVAGTEAEEGNLVFTDTGEFCRSLQLDDAIIRRAGAKDAFGEDEEETPAAVSEEDPSKHTGGWTEVMEIDKTHHSDEEESDDGEPMEEPLAEVSVGKGLAGALNLLKERGTLRETVDWGGRNMDKKRSKLVGIVDDSNDQVGQRDILLDRVDEFGRTMTPKEAFRRLSHKFHGKGPGKMKQEKKMKQWQEELRLKQMNSGDTPLMSMEKMWEAQARMHTPYIVISGHIKPGQTSDPRSGFATVEKEPIGSLTPMLGDKGVGSLTPMLGDKKVEHFLGIKRKAESGSMGPPPAKEPKL